jgi:hypothetical protein
MARDTAWDYVTWAAVAVVAALGLQFGGPLWTWVSNNLPLKTLLPVVAVPLKTAWSSASGWWHSSQKRKLQDQLMKACKEPVIRTTSELLWRVNQLDGMACLDATKLERNKPEVAAKILALQQQNPERWKELREHVLVSLRRVSANSAGGETLEDAIANCEFLNSQAEDIGDVSALQVYVYVKQLLGREYWLKDATQSKKHREYQVEHTCFLIGSFFYWIEVRPTLLLVFRVHG